MSLPLSVEQLDQLQPVTKELLLQHFNDQNTRLDDIRAKYERLRVDSGMTDTPFRLHVKFVFNEIA